MFYLLIGTVAGGFVFLYSWIYRKDRNSFSKYAKLSISVLLNPEIVNSKKAYGCVILEVGGLTDEIKEIVFNGVVCTNPNLYFSHYGELKFPVIPGNFKKSVMRSVGFSMWKTDLKKIAQKNDTLIIKGSFEFLNGKKSNFLLSSPYKLEGLGNFNAFENKISLPLM